MSFSSLRFTIVSLVALLLAVAASATPRPLRMEHAKDLDDFRGQTFLATMIAEDGIVADMDEDYNQTYEFPTWSEVQAALKNFDRKNLSRVWAAFGKSEARLREFVERYQGETFKPSGLYGFFQGKVKGNIASIGHFFGMAAGAGSLVTIDENNYFYSIGYEEGEVRSGRTYAASPEHPANDVSHKKYLSDLEKFLEGNQDELFYSILLDILTDTDDSEFAKLSDLGESVATDFVAVYVAELRRHLMMKLHPNRNEWGNDYIEVTAVSAYCSAAGGKIILKVTDENGRTALRLKNAPLWKWWELNPATGRSGIGKTQRERRMLQRHITSYMKENHRDLVAAVERVTGRRADVFQGLSEFLNNFDTPRDLGADADRLSRAFVALLAQVQADAEEITAYIYEKDRKLEPRSGDREWTGRD